MCSLELQISIHRVRLGIVFFEAARDVRIVYVKEKHVRQVVRKLDNTIHRVRKFLLASFIGFSCLKAMAFGEAQECCKREKVVPYI